LAPPYSTNAEVEQVLQIASEEVAFDDQIDASTDIQNLIKMRVILLPILGIFSIEIHKNDIFWHPKQLFPCISEKAYKQF
jgi:hypothetical protein